MSLLHNLYDNLGVTFRLIRFEIPPVPVYLQFFVPVYHVFVLPFWLIRLSQFPVQTRSFATCFLLLDSG